MSGGKKDSAPRAQMNHLDASFGPGSWYSQVQWVAEN